MPRITSDISDQLQNDIKNLADEKKWSFSYMVSVLLQYAVKEKRRKKKNNTEHHPADTRSDYSGGSHLLPHSQEQVTANGPKKITKN